MNDGVEQLINYWLTKAASAKDAMDALDKQAASSETDIYRNYQFIYDNAMAQAEWLKHNVKDGKVIRRGT